MALRCELLKSSAVAIVVLLHVLSHCPLPSASVVTLATIQSYSLLACVLECLTPSKQVKQSAMEEAIPTMAAGFFSESARAGAKALGDRAWVRNTAWLASAILFKQVAVLTGLSNSPLLLAAAAISSGALGHRIAATLVSSGGCCAGTGSPYDATFWPSTSAQAEVPEESPLASMAQDFCTDPLTVQLPSIEIQG